MHTEIETNTHKHTETLAHVYRQQHSGRSNGAHRSSFSTPILTLAPRGRTWRKRWNFLFAEADAFRQERADKLVDHAEMQHRLQWMTPLSVGSASPAP